MSNGSDGEWAHFLDRFIHDLREPLRSVHSFTELLGEVTKAEPESETGQILREIVDASLRIRMLADALSGYATALRGDEGAASLQLAFNMTTLNLDREIQGAGASVTGEGLPRVRGSLEGLLRVMTNLIGNSLRFRSEAPPEIRVSAREESTGWWEIRVEDNGIGMEPGDCEAVFEPFVRLHGRKYPGAGLGLCICRKIVEGHGGKIRMEPRQGHGSVCSFTLQAADD